MILSPQNDKEKKPEKFDFEKMKRAATHENAAVRKEGFIEYFERFAEFPTYLFDTEPVVDARLLETIQDILKDPASSKEVHKGIEALMQRLPSA